MNQVADPPPRPAGPAPVVALTFDMEHPSRAGHDPASPGRILDTLATFGATSTFFVQGRWARAEPQLTRRVLADGHLLASHGHFHAPLDSLTDDGIDRDVSAAAAALVEVTGHDPRPWFRCPFGAGHDDPRVQRALARNGFTNVHWNVEPQDWFEDCTPGALVASTLSGVAERGDAAVVLLHTWPRATADALPLLLRELAGAYRLATVDDPALSAAVEGS